MVDNVEEVEKLFKDRKSDVAKTNSKCTPINIPGEQGHSKVVNYFLLQRASIYSTDHETCTALMVASSNGHLDVVKILLQHQKLYKNTYNDRRKGISCRAHNCCSNSITSSNEQLLSNDIQYIDIVNDDGNTALHLAAKNGYLEVVMYLYDQGSNMNNTNKAGYNSLMLAAANGHLSIVK